MNRGARDWRPVVGAVPVDAGFRFTVWAPTRERVDLVIDPSGARRRRIPLAPAGDGTFAGTVGEIAGGDRYAYLLDGEGPYPDPASRSQPDGVHGPSAVVDPRGFPWSDAGWRGVPLERSVIYELHVGTFTEAGTFRAAIERLPDLADLGVTAIELMPVADFPGAHNWGYDGVSLFAPARVYGSPDDLRALVDAAHALGLAVLLDVVYNHFGPDGAYFTTFSPFYLSTRHSSPWGGAVNLDGEQAHHVRAFFIENALHWLHEYHVDGLRLDATHGLIDDRPRHFLQELCATLRASVSGRTILLIAEDERNLRTLVLPEDQGGWGLDAVWADDFHHQVRRLTAGDADGYYADYTGSADDLAATVAHGWFFRGQHSAYLGRARGTDPAGVPPPRLVFCIQNHDQIGNRPFGRRLHHQVEGAVFRAASALLLCAPQTPLLFMGQEWAASTPFLFFTDHHDELGRLVTEGRRNEFSRFSAFADAATRARIPDPQAPETFARSRLQWRERDRMPHAGVHALYRALLHLRATEPALAGNQPCSVAAVGARSLMVTRRAAAGDTLLLAVHVGAGERIALPAPGAAAGPWAPVLTTEDPAFAGPDERAPIDLDLDQVAPAVRFPRAGAVLLRAPAGASSSVR